MSVNVDLCAGPDARPGFWQRALGSPWAVVFVFALALLLRGCKLTEWSMWEDEEGTVYYSQQTDKAFAKAFPVFFVALNGVYAVTGVSVAAGRVFSAAVASLGLVLLYVCFRKMVSRQVAVGAVLLLAVSLGHVFWSQSIRYYNLVVVFQLLSAYWFLRGFERGSYPLLALSLAAFVLAMYTHFSAVLLAPVFVGYLLLAVWKKDRGGASGWKGYLVFGAALLAILALFYWQLKQMQGMLGNFVIPSARDPVHVLATIVAYFGVPVLALGLLGPFVAPRNVSPRVVRFFVLLGVVPVLEMLVIAGLGTINVTYYYGLISLSAFAVLAAFALVGLYERGRRVLALCAGAAALVYSAVFLVGYYTSGYGDRPRWQEAAHYLRDAGDVRADSANPPEVYATVPGVVAHYLGVDPGQTMSDTLVRRLPQEAPAADPTAEQWYVIEAGQAGPSYEAWLAAHCRQEASFEARTGFRDRSVTVYHYVPGDGPKRLATR